jgi:hypothetical protein
MQICLLSNKKQSFCSIKPLQNMQFSLLWQALCNYQNGACKALRVAERSCSGHNVAVRAKYHWNAGVADALPQCAVTAAPARD